jgi:hypothetical protein
VRYKVWESLDELKQALQEEWAKVTMQEVRARISEMPERCRLLVESGGGPIKSALWWLNVEIESFWRLGEISGGGRIMSATGVQMFCGDVILQIFIEIVLPNN